MASPEMSCSCDSRGLLAKMEKLVLQAPWGPRYVTCFIDIVHCVSQWFSKVFMNEFWGKE